MTSTTTAPRLLAISLWASISLAAFAPAANAGHGHGDWKKYRRGDDGPHYVERVAACPAPRIVEYRRGSRGGSTLAGFVSGLALGVILSSAQQSCAAPAHAYCPPPDRCGPPRDEYGYEDPYCHERFSSLDVYLIHARHHDHPRVVRVIEMRDGECVQVLHYDHGQWGDWHDTDWDD